MFLHFTVAPEVLQPQCAFPLDRWKGEAVVSLVAFTMRRFRLARGGRLGAWLCWPFREQCLLNLRTYVNVQGEPGITFLAEWVSDRVQVPFGPLIYGLPYRWGRHRFEHGVPGCWNGRVTERPDETNELRYRVRDQGGGFAPARAGSRDEFLLERHTCFLRGRGRGRRFRIWHEPWAQRAVTAEIIEDGLLRHFAPWWRDTKLIGANTSPGVRDVWMGRPHTLATVVEPA